MDLYLIRHADADPLGAGVAEDADRPLSIQGQSQCPPLATALKRQGVHLDRVLTSPLLRARQTAEGLLKDWPAPAPELQECELLLPGLRPRKLARFLNDLEVKTVALVGHMPDLGTFVAWLIGSKKAQVDLAKAGCARIECEGKPNKGSGVLTWLITPEWCSNSRA
jgi:phosphohistidine phosphatase